MPLTLLFCWRPRRDLNPCYRRERAVSWAGLDDGDAWKARNWTHARGKKATLNISIAAAGVKIRAHACLYSNPIQSHNCQSAGTRKPNVPYLPETDLSSAIKFRQQGRFCEAFALELNQNSIAMSKIPLRRHP